MQPPPPVPPARGRSESSPRRREPNRLAGEASRYLVAHAYDPVDWYPWGDDAFAVARERDMPIFLSSGFLSCHWCCIMASHFREPEVAALLNGSFVSILLDREERIDVDEVYQTFVQAVSPDGRSGWPMTVFLTPELTPFVGTTYLQKDRLLAALTSISARWRETRNEVVADGAKVIDALREFHRAKRQKRGEQLGKDTLDAAYKAASTSFDVDNGGFGPQTPKFPRASLFEFLCGMSLLHGTDSRVGRDSIDMLSYTLLKMSQGGIFDQLNGSFFRYSIDAAWQIPRFEKLLTDQAQLSMSYLQAYFVGAKVNSSFRTIVSQTLDFCLDNMRLRSGVFASAVDSDSLSPFDTATGDDSDSSEGKEGAFYLWSDFELNLLLGREDARLFSMRYGITAEGNMVGGGAPDVERGHDFVGLSIPRISSSIETLADVTGSSPDQVALRLDVCCAKLLAERNRRPRPKLDDLVVVFCNGLVISALARAGRALKEARYLYAAFQALDHILERMVARVDENLDALFLYRTFREDFGPGRVEAFAQDYVSVVQACIDCFEASPPETGGKYLVAALKLQRALDSSFWDAENGGYFATADGDSTILLRQKEDYDGSEPSASSIAALNCVRLASLTGSETLWRRARDIFDAFASVITNSQVLAMPLLLVSVQAFVSEGSKKVVIIGSDGDASDFLSEFWSRGFPRSIALLRIPLDGAGEDVRPLLSRGRQSLTAKDGAPTAYVCTGRLDLRRVTVFVLHLLTLILTLELLCLPYSLQRRPFVPRTHNVCG